MRYRSHAARSAGSQCSKPAGSGQAGSASVRAACMLCCWSCLFWPGCLFSCIILCSFDGSRGQVQQAGSWSFGLVSLPFIAAASGHYTLCGLQSCCACVATECSGHAVLDVKVFTCCLQVIFLPVCPWRTEPEQAKGWKKAVVGHVSHVTVMTCYLT